MGNVVIDMMHVVGRLNESIVVSSNKPRSPYPALLTTTSMPPNVSSA
jgi:hypothetical protein